MQLAPLPAVRPLRDYILGVDGDILSGRFAMDLVSSDGSTTLTFSDGSFKAKRQ